MSDSNGTIDFTKIMLPTLSENSNPFGSGTKDKTKESRKPNEVWLNVGIPFKGPDGKVVLLTLPIGIPCDDLEPMPIPRDKEGKNPLFKQQRQAEAALLVHFKDQVAKMKPGQREFINGFACELYRAEPKATLANADLSENQFMSALKNMSVGQPQVSAPEQETE